MQTKYFSRTDQRQGQTPLTGRCIESNVLTVRLRILGRLAAQKRMTMNGDIRNHISEHHRLTKHRIDWNSAECVSYSTNYQQRLALESWYTNSEQEPLNRCQQLPAPYKRIIHDFKRNRQTIDGSKITATTTDQSLQLSRFNGQLHHDKLT